MFKSLNLDVFQSWPQVDKEMLVVENVKIVVQINGKKRGILEMSKDVDEKTLLEMVKKEERLIKKILIKKIKRNIFCKKID